MAISVVAHCQYFANILFWKFEKKKHESKFVQHFVNFCFGKVLFSVLFGISFKEGTALFAGAWWIIAGHTFISHNYNYYQSLLSSCHFIIGEFLSNVLRIKYQEKEQSERETCVLF